jgi:hypothetical protein
MTVKYENGTIILVTSNSISLEELTELAHYYFQFLPAVKVHIRTTMLRENQEITYHPVTEEVYKNFLAETNLK